MSDTSVSFPSPPVILTIAGSDSGGGAGVQADLKTITVLGGFGVSVITALTAQNGGEVRGIHEAPPEFVRLQWEAVADGFPLAAAKTGMLASASIINAVADALEAARSAVPSSFAAPSTDGERAAPRRFFPLVADPVCVSQSGYRLLREGAVDALRTRILPLADLLTPNRPEAELLSGLPLRGPEDVAAVGARLLEMGAKAVLIKGGHFELFSGGGSAAAQTGAGRTMTDWLIRPGLPPLALSHACVDTPNNHGTGCTLSAAIATFLGFGHGLEEAVRRAQDFLTRALAASFAPGLGAGPPNFLAGRVAED